MHCNECIIWLVFQDDFVCVDALHPCQQFFSHIGMFSKVEAVLNRDKVS